MSGRGYLYLMTLKVQLNQHNLRNMSNLCNKSVTNNVAKQSSCSWMGFDSLENGKINKN